VDLDEVEKRLEVSPEPDGDGRNQFDECRGEGDHDLMLAAI
jgi:hypothetical protein